MPQYFQVSDGIIAAGFEPEALAILMAKKEGKFIVLQGDVTFKPLTTEFKEVYGLSLGQVL